MENLEHQNKVVADALAPRSIEDMTAHFFNRLTPRPKRVVLGSIYSIPQ